MNQEQEFPKECEEAKERFWDNFIRHMARSRGITVECETVDVINTPQNIQNSPSLDEVERSRKSAKEKAVCLKRDHSSSSIDRRVKQRLISEETIQALLTLPMTEDRKEEENEEESDKEWQDAQRDSSDDDAEIIAAAAEAEKQYNGVKNSYC